MRIVSCECCSVWKKAFIPKGSPATLPSVSCRNFSQRVQDAISVAVPFSGICFRNVSQRFANQQEILSARGSLIGGGRFNFKGLFEVLYLFCDVHTCLEETTKSLQRAGRDVARALPRTIVGVDVTSSQVLNLTDPVIRKLTIGKPSRNPSGASRVTPALRPFLSLRRPLVMAVTWTSSPTVFSPARN